METDSTLFYPVADCGPDVTICLDSVTYSSKMQVNPVCEPGFELNVEHDINIHDVKQFSSEVCNVSLLRTGRVMSRTSQCWMWCQSPHVPCGTCGD